MSQFSANCKCNTLKCSLVLQELSLAGNQLTTLPDGIGNLQYLNRLQLSGNYLQQLPDSLCQLTSLQVKPVSRVMPSLTASCCSEAPPQHILYLPNLTHAWGSVVTALPGNERIAPVQ